MQIHWSYLHVSGEHDEFCPRLFNDVHQLGLGLRLIFLRDFDVVERNIVVDDQFLIKSGGWRPTPTMSVGSAPIFQR
nr:hypothetical protein [Mesorhizobium sp. WSM3862]